MVHGHETPSHCPACYSPRVACILYGLPDFSPELERDMNAGRVVLGGCSVFEDSPEWQCMACRHRWGRLEGADPLMEDFS